MDFIILALAAASATMAVDHYNDDAIHSPPVATEQVEQVVVTDFVTEINNTGTANSVTWVFEVGVQQ
tara:strand:+ start:496 stop:696 length:201 start_codon:yes stop_codon:yes gene_type:complete